MSETNNQRGGKREGAGRHPLPVTKRKPPKEYLRTPVAIPWTNDQIEAVAWWESLTPRDRLMYIKDLWGNCGYPKPHTP